MRKVLAFTIAAALAGGLTVTTAADAAPRGKRHAKAHAAKKHARRNEAPVSGASASDATSYYEMDANKLPFGSSRWWEQMMREGRLGGGYP
jgi:hypothetical protein